MLRFSEEHSNELIAKKNYYAHLLDNIGPLPKEITSSLPIKIFYSIWEEFYHYLSLVAETARPTGGSNFINYIESHPHLQGLPNLSEITSYLVYGKISDYPDAEKLDYWLNINSLLEYGTLYKNLSDKEKESCQRFEYIQELDHFSEIMDLSLLTKHISKGVDNIDKETLKKNPTILKYLIPNSNSNIYKPIAGRSKYVNLGLERMVGEAAAKRRNGQYIIYKDVVGNIGEYNKNFYPMQTTAQVEAQFKVVDLASVGSVRTNYPYLGLLLTSNSSVPLAQDEIKKLNNICLILVLQYGLEMGLAMFDGYIFDNEYQQYLLSLIIVQAFKLNNESPIQIKIMSVGSGAALIYQKHEIQHIEVSHDEEKGSFVGNPGAVYQRKIVTVNQNQNIKIVLAPYSYGAALHSIPYSQLLQDANKNAQNPLEWVMKLPSKEFKISKDAKNLLSFHVSPDEMDVVSSPKWDNDEITKIPEFQPLADVYKAYLNKYKHLEINILYAHLHADRFVDVHQEISTKVALAFKNELEGDNISFTLQPLIDNLHVIDIFDYKKYNDILLEKELAPHVILTEDSLLIDRIGQGILYYITQQNTDSDYKVIFEGNRTIGLLYTDNTIVQLIDHMDKDGRLACVTFDLPQIYYRQAPDLCEKLFREDILLNYPNTILGRLFVKYPKKNYHQIMYDEIYTNSDIKYRNELFQKIAKEIRPNINTIEDTKPMLRYVDALKDEIMSCERTLSKKVISMYILEGSYDAQFDRYSKVHTTFAIPGIDTYRVSFVSEELKFNIMSIHS